MARYPTHEELGEPALRTGGLQLWVHGYEFPDLSDVWDGNWLRVTAHCGAAGASVWVSGPLLMTFNLKAWAEQCASLRDGQADVAELASVEPELKVRIVPSDALGHFRVEVEITPDHMTQRHWFEFEIDQTYLPGIARECREIVRTYPVRGEKANE